MLIPFSQRWNSSKNSSLATSFKLFRFVGTVGPVAAGVDAEKIRNYYGGVFNDFHCGHNINYAVLIDGCGRKHKYD